MPSELLVKGARDGRLKLDWVQQYRELAVLLVVIAVVALLSLARRQGASPTPGPSASMAGTTRPTRRGSPRADLSALSIRGIRPGMTRDEVKQRVGPPVGEESGDQEDSSVVTAWTYDDTAAGRAQYLARVCFDADGKVRRVEGEVVEPVFSRPSSSSTEVERVFGVKPQQGHWDDVDLSDGTRLEVTRGDLIYFRLSR